MFLHKGMSPSKEGIFELPKEKCGDDQQIPGLILMLVGLRTTW